MPLKKIAPIKVNDAATAPADAVVIDLVKDTRLKQKDIKRAHWVVDQCRTNEIDLLADAGDETVILNSLVVLGEEAREVWHRLGQLHHHYDEKVVNEIFTDAMALKKLRNPSKFFAIAKDYGLDVRMPKTMAEAKAEVDYKEIIGEDNNIDDYIKYGIWLDNGTYHVLSQKNIPLEVSNFQMRILYHVETSDDEAFRLVEIKNIHGFTSVVNMNTDDFVSVAGFKKIVARKGNFIWKGTEPDLCRLQDKLQREERPTELVKQLGWHRKGAFYVFANGIYDPEDNRFLPIDMYGIVEHKIRGKNGAETLRNFFIPAMSKIFEDKDDKFANDKKFVYKSTEHSFSTWAAQYVKVYGDMGKMALVFYVMSLFSDIIFKDMSQRFPILNVYGKRGTGKGTLIASLMRLFGEGQDQLMLGGASTVVGFMRKFGQFSNTIVWLDEYKNNLKANYIESLKNIFDRIGYERGKKDNTFQTESTPIRSACILSGQEMPTIEPALFTRVVLLMLTETKYNDAQREEFRKLSRWETAGLSGITVDLLKYREYFERGWKDKFELELKALIKNVNNADVEERMLQSYASVIATAILLSEKEQLPFKPDDFRKLAKETLLNQFFVLKGSDDATKFFEVVEQLHTQGQIQDNKHFKLADGYLYLRVQDIYPFYAEALIRRRDPNVLDKSTLDKYLESDAKIFIAKVRKMFGGKYSWCYQFKYKELGIDLIREENDMSLREKYKEMKLDMPVMDEDKKEAF